MAPKYKSKMSKVNQPKVSVNTLTNIQTSSPGTSGEQMISGPPGTSSSEPQTSLMRCTILKSWDLHVAKLTKRVLIDPYIHFRNLVTSDDLESQTYFVAYYTI